MGLISLSVGDEFSFKGIKHVVVALEPPLITIERIEGNRGLTDINYLELINDLTFIPINSLIKKVEKQNDIVEQRYRSIIDTLTEDQRKKVTKRFELIKPILIFENASKGDLKSIAIFHNAYGYLLKEEETLNQLTKETLFKRIKEQHGKSERQLKRYLSDYKNAELYSPKNGLEGLIPKSVKVKTIRKDECLIEICHPHNKELILDTIYVRVDEKYVPLIKNVIENYYLKKIKPTIQKVTEQLEILCFKKGLKPLGYDTVYHIIEKRLSDKVKNRMRLGELADERYNSVTRGFSNEIAVAPLHIIQIDHTELDLDVIDDKSGSNFGRPWITLGIDLYSRMVWCLHVSFEPPSANKVRKAIQHGIFMKNSKEKYDTVNEWDMYGIPSIIYFDNGSEFNNAAIKELIDETLGSQVMYRPRGTPRYGGVIERLFGTLNKGLIHDMAGTRKSNVKELGSYDAESEAVFTLSDIEEILITYIADVYHHQNHTGLPLEYPTPTLRYYYGIETGGYPDFIPHEEEREFGIKLLPTQKRLYTREGIRFRNIIYNSPTTSKYIGMQKGQFIIKYDDDDISSIYVLDPKTREYVFLPAQYPPADELKNLNYYTYKKRIEILREHGEINKNQIPGSKHLLKGKILLKEKIAKKMKTNKKFKQMAKRTGFELVSKENLENLTGKNISNNSSLEELMNEFNREVANKKNGRK
ncbi:Mu transposase C-terminal domain-containing protein [Litchfieldia alkalitelluris]|uniref:Mu transposase C-terminal domain-containing protein n=1 Tax=Litchfieldia alkalitelluris TaxID=304268 RepID=UPI0009965C19|nr:Mu transposase C-terminal domain-containing protein [Litchfieldia alkalitelluris]